jgi:crotonobetainyl-CoA:carnitine CoA-transferase CaiB-like acyl-CoA transferase
MPSPKDNAEKMERMINAWRTLAPDKTFGGMTLEQFEAFAAPCRESRQRITQLEDQLTQEIATRERADADFAAKARLVVAGVLADPTEGADSALYQAFGYTRESERKTGLTRRKREEPPKQ